jgi:hypothetical protein
MTTVDTPKKETTTPKASESKLPSDIAKFLERSKDQLPEQLKQTLESDTIPSARQLARLLKSDVVTTVSLAANHPVFTEGAANEDPLTHFQLLQEMIQAPSVNDALAVLAVLELVSGSEYLVKKLPALFYGTKVWNLDTYALVHARLQVWPFHVYFPKTEQVLPVATVKYVYIYDSLVAMCAHRSGALFVRSTD